MFLVAAGGLLAAAATAIICLVVWTRRESRRPRVVCLMYHRLVKREAFERISGTERIFTLPSELFDAQIGHLKARGYRFLNADEALDFASGRLRLDGEGVLVTFDDGCRSVMTEALPILRRHGACATLFVTTDPDAYVFKLGDASDPRMSDEELSELDGPVIRLESHAVSHRPLRGMSEAEIEGELRDSKAHLERLTGRAIGHLAIPGNWYDDRVLRIARATGYRSVWCSRPGGVHPGASPLGLPRVNVEGLLDLDRFDALLLPGGLAQRRLIGAVKSAPGRLLGPRAWQPIRRAVLRCVPGGFMSFRRWKIAIGVLCLLVILLAVLFFAAG